MTQEELKQDIIKHPENYYRVGDFIISKYTIK